MLILTRKPGQLIRLWLDPDISPNTLAAEVFAAGPIEIGVGCVINGQVRIGIAADKRFVIMRAEIVDRGC